MTVRGPEGFELVLREGTDLKWKGVSHVDMMTHVHATHTLGPLPQQGGSDAGAR